MKLSKLRTAASWLAICLLLVAGGCSDSESSLLKLVPSSAQAVIATNLDKLAHEAGYTELPAAMPAWLTAGTNALGNLNDVGKAIDTRHIVTFALSGSNFASIAHVADESALEALASGKGMAKSTVSGFTLYKGAGVQIAVKDHIAWVAPDAVATAKLCEEQCKEDGEYTLWKGLTQYLDTDRAMSIVTCLEAAEASQKGSYLCAAVSGNQEAASVDVCLMQADGEKIKNDALAPLQTNFLRYLPTNFNAVAAAGITDKVDWDKIGAFLDMAAGYQARGTFDSVLDVLKQCNGTLAIAADGYSLPSPQPYFMLMVHMPQDKVNATVNEVIDQLKTMGVKTNTRPDGQTELLVPGLRLFVGSVDGYLAFGSQPFVADHGSALTTVFEGQRAAVSVKLETLRTYRLDLDYGLDISAKTGDTDTNIRVAFPGSKERPLANLLNLLALLL